MGKMVGWRLIPKNELCCALLINHDGILDKYVEEHKHIIPEDVVDAYNIYKREKRLFQFPRNITQCEIDILNWTKKMKYINNIDKLYTQIV